MGWWRPLTPQIEGKNDRQENKDRKEEVEKGK